MTQPSYKFNAPVGYAGTITRIDKTTVESIFLGTPNAPAFGIPLKNDGTGKAIPFAGGELASALIGFLGRSLPEISGSSAAEDVPNPPQPQNLITRGYLNVVCTQGTPARFAPVYVRTVAASGKAIGDLEATIDQTGAGVAGTNTGNGTISAITVAAPAQKGVYSIVFTAATKFNVFDPSGVELVPGTTGVAYSQEGVGFTITAGGTAFVAGDTFNVTITQNNVALSDVAWAVNGKDTANGNIAEIKIGK